MNIWIVSVIVLILNLPFGYWRARTKPFSAQWLLAIHLPVPLVVSLRIYGGIGWQFMTFTLLAGFFLAGQWLGGRIRDWRADDKPVQVK